MSLWELRQYIESHIPWYVPCLIWIIFALIYSGYLLFKREK